jgi:transposase
VYEIPRPEVHVTEHRIHGCSCPKCGARCVGRLGADVPRGSFGPRLEALTVYLGAAFRMSVRERVRLLDEFFGLRLSAGTVKAIDNRVSTCLESVYEEALEWVRSASVAHADETSWPLGNVLGWLWTAVTEQVSLFRIDAERSGDAFERLFGTGFGGILESDRLASYDRLPADKRQLCWAHLRRDFTRFAEQPIREVREFGQCGLFICEQLFDVWHAFLDEHHDRARLQRELRPVRNDLGALLLTGALSPHPRVPGFSKHLLQRAGALFQFADVPGVVPTNNNAERALRPAVLWRKGSFGSRSRQGQRFVERVLTVVASLRKQGRSVLDFLTEACSCYLHGLAPPSILPVSP